MTKEFMEYQQSFSKLPNNSSDICIYLLTIRDKYLNTQKEDKRFLKLIIKDIIESIYNMKCYKEEQELNLEYLITILIYKFSKYSYDDAPEFKTLREKMKVTKEEAAIILTNFLNYIMKENYYARVFTVEDLKNKYLYQQHQEELLNLKIFLSKVNKYCLLLGAGKNIDNLLKEYLEEEGIDRISKNGVAYYTKEKYQNLNVGKSSVPFEKNIEILTEIDAISYAYYKYIHQYYGKTEESKNKLIYSRIKKMKKREEV